MGGGTLSEVGPTIKRRSKRWREGPGIASLVLLAMVAITLLAAVALIFGTIQTERKQRAQVVRTTEVLRALGDIGRAAINGETGQRGYFITGDERYLEPYRLGESQAGPALARLEVLLASGSTDRQRELLAEVQRLSGKKWAELTGTVAQVQRGERLDAEVRILSDEGQLAMTRLRGTIAELETIERALLDGASRRTEAAEARILPLLALLLAATLAALALGLYQVVRTARAEAAAAQAQSLSEARDRADLLARELNHRVKNLFAVILAIVQMSAKGSPEAKPVVAKISARIHALVTAHEVTQGSLDRPVVDLRELIETAIAPYRSESETCEVEGEEVTLPAELAVPLGLVLHELVTNAVKYGAWRGDGGAVSVRWKRDGDQLRLAWREDGAALTQPSPTSGREGFGSVLIKTSAQQLGGTIQRDFHAAGIEVTLSFPL